jgi:hypothetical protein
MVDSWHKYRKDSTERTRQWREKAIERGAKHFSAVLDPETVEMIEAIKERFPRYNNKRLVMEAIKLFYDTHVADKIPLQ